MYKETETESLYRSLSLQTWTTAKHWQHWRNSSDFVASWLRRRNMHRLPSWRCRTATLAISSSRLQALVRSPMCRKRRCFAVTRGPTTVDTSTVRLRTVGLGRLQNVVTTRRRSNARERCRSYKPRLRLHMQRH